MKKKTTLPVIEQRYSYKNYLAAFTLHNLDKLPGNKGVELISKFEPTLREYVRKHGGIKYHISTRCLVKKTLNGKTIQELDDFFITTFTTQIINESEIQNSLKADIQYEIDDIPERETRGSGYVFDRVITHEIQLAKYAPLKGSHYLKLPDDLKAKRAIINVQNKDEKCFMWAVLSALYPADKHADRVSKYQKYIENHDWSMLDFPVPVNQIAKFEERNNLSINVYGWNNYYQKIKPVVGTTYTKNRSEKKAPHLLHKSKQHSAPQQINLLLLQTANASHYCWIKHFSRFACVASDQKNGKREYCRYCLKAFDATHLNKKDPKYRTAQQRLDEHLKMGCREITEVTPEMPDPVCVDPKSRCAL